MKATQGTGKKDYNGNGSPCKIITERHESRTGQRYPHRNTENAIQGKRTASHKGNGQRHTGNAQHGHGRTERTASHTDTDGHRKPNKGTDGKKPRLSILENRLKNFFQEQNFTPKHFLQTFGAARSQDQKILVREIWRTSEVIYFEKH